MLPLLTFATGIVVGAVGLKVVKGLSRARTSPAEAASPEDKPLGEGAPSSESSRSSADDGSIVNRACDGLRSAAVSGLSAVERSSATLREKLSPEPESPKEAPQNSGAGEEIEQGEPQSDTSAAPMSSKPGETA